MSHHNRKILDTRMVFGIFIIAAGILILLDNLYLIRFDFWDWWPAILVLLGIAQLAQPSAQRHYWGGLILIALGALFLADIHTCFYLRWSLVWPAILIIVGISILRHNVRGRKITDDVDFINLSFILGGGEHRYHTRQLKGGKLTAIMGGGTIDLREADMEGEVIEFDAFALWGGIEIRVPTSWQVNIQGTPILAGIENKTTAAKSDKGQPAPWQGNKKLVIKGTAIMAGIEITN